MKLKNYLIEDVSFTEDDRAVLCLIHTSIPYKDWAGNDIVVQMWKDQNVYPVWVMNPEVFSEFMLKVGRARQLIGYDAGCFLGEVLRAIMSKNLKIEGVSDGAGELNGGERRDSDHPGPYSDSTGGRGSGVDSKDVQSGRIISVSSTGDLGGDPVADRDQSCTVPVSMWRGTPITDLPREELIEALEIVGTELYETQERLDNLGWGIR